MENKNTDTDQELLPKPLTDLPEPEEELSKHASEPISSSTANLASRGQTLEPQNTTIVKDEKPKRKKIILIGIILLLFLFIPILLIQVFARPINAPFLCKEEYRICASRENKRSGLKCEFKKCPSVDLTKHSNDIWEFSNSTKTDHYTFKNNEYEYIFEAPINWNFLQLDNGFELISPNYIRSRESIDLVDYGTRISLFTNTSKYNTEGEYLKSKTDEIYDSSNFKTPTETQVADSRAVKINNNNNTIIYTFFIKNGIEYLIAYSTTGIDQEDGYSLYNQILSTFKFTEPKISCTPRPSCLDSFPRCMIPETSDMCPPTLTPTKTSSGDGKPCTQEAKLCPDGSYVGRTGPNCEFSPCPK